MMIMIINGAIKCAPFGSLDSLFDDSPNSTNDKFYVSLRLIIDVLDSVAPLKMIRIKANYLSCFHDEMRNITHTFALKYSLSFTYRNISSV